MCEVPPRPGDNMEYILAVAAVLAAQVQPRLKRKGLDEPLTPSHPL